MQQSSVIGSRPLSIPQSTEAQVYGLFAVAMGLSLVGVYFGTIWTNSILNGGLQFALLIAELGIVLTARLWMDKSPLNLILFATFPILSGITVAPFISSVMIGYENGPSILANALAATSFMAAAAAVFARTTSWNLSGMGRGLLFALIGLIGLALVQLFVPSLQGGQFELLLSGAGVVIFALFLAYDIQRISKVAKLGANPFLLALNLYLDIFNLFLYIVRFMIALSGNRR